MPLGWERINAKQSSPNKNIVFIKPRPGPDELKSKEYLERIAAQCLPIMNKEYLSVVSLEEYEPNHEFWGLFHCSHYGKRNPNAFQGRNFNNGEVIQLVLRSPSTGHWLPFRFVQMVMMHELAHCKEMNHSKAFWTVRNKYAAEMKVLWKENYTGEGLWGSGRLLEDGNSQTEVFGKGENLPKHLCGGTFRSRIQGKRKAKPQITWKETKERRIRKKFGVNGVALGADDDAKAKLENGKRSVGKPRVAGSLRGRDLRAAAALARFETSKVEQEAQRMDGDLVTDSESDDFDLCDGRPEPDDAVDFDGKRLLDSRGNGMVKVCDDPGADESAVKREIEDLCEFGDYLTHKHTPHVKQETTSPKLLLPATNSPSETFYSPQNSGKVDAPQATAVSPRMTPKPKDTKNCDDEASSEATITCNVCSVANHKMALTCSVCSNVLKPEFVVRSWRCTSELCSGSNYVNAGDVGICGACGFRKDQINNK